MPAVSRNQNAEVFSLCLRALLRPLVRFCLRHSIKLQEFLELAKSVFLEMGMEELGRQDAAPSTSRIAVMTGLHRKDVERLKAGIGTRRAAGDIFTRVVGQWQTDPRFSSKRGSPRPLKLEGKEGDFVTLVESVSRELNPYTILF